MSRSVIGIALFQAFAVGLITFLLIVGVEYVWAGRLIDVGLYALASSGVMLLVFVIALRSARQRRDARHRSAGPH